MGTPQGVKCSNGELSIYRRFRVFEQDAKLKQNPAGHGDSLFQWVCMSLLVQTGSYLLNWFVNGTPVDHYVCRRYGCERSCLRVLRAKFDF